jgi:small-conductance mechanosensitive channel
LNSPSFAQLIPTQASRSTGTTTAQAPATGGSSYLKNLGLFKANRSQAKQDESMDNLKNAIRKINYFLSNGLDTAEIRMKLRQIQEWDSMSAENTFHARRSIQTNRNLATSFMLVTQLLESTESLKRKISSYQEKIRENRIELDSLTADSTFLALPGDSLSLILFYQKVTLIGKDYLQVDSALKATAFNVYSLELLANSLISKFSADLTRITEAREGLIGITLKREQPNIWNYNPYDWPLKDNLKFSLKKNFLLISFYAKNNSGNIFLVVLAVLFLSFFLSALKAKLKNNPDLSSIYSVQDVLRYPLLSSLFICLSILQFIFIDAPFVFYVFFWIIPALCLTFILYQPRERFWLSVWLITFSLFLATCLDYIILQVSWIERWGIFALCLSLIVLGLIIIFNHKKHNLREKWIIYALIFIFILECVSLIAIVFGRYNFAKSLFTSGYFNLFVGILLLWTIRLLNELLSLASEVYKNNSGKAFYIDFKKIGRELPFIFYVFLFLAWFELFSRHFYFFQVVLEPFKHFFVSERIVGAYTFSIKSIVIFIVILFLAGMTSKVVSFFASDAHVKPGPDNLKKGGIGSWLLLIRIAIISLGIFVAFAAAGIPMDRLALVLGALSVGIGFGLQTLVNNLVSGLIIAFEKPVNVGDIVDIGQQSGTMKSIGFRSSVITTFDGADMIIPNGDMLNQHLINWTLSDQKRRIEVLVGVAYGTNLEVTRSLVIEILKTDERILVWPTPMVLFNRFSDSSIDIRILFWINQSDDWLIVKSDVISAVEGTFRLNGIVIPFPQRDVNLREISHDKEAEEEQSV